MSAKKFFVGVASGLIALLVEMAFFGGSFIVDLLEGIFPESAANLSSMLSAAIIVNFFVNLIVGVTAFFDWRGMRGFAVGFLVGVFIDLCVFWHILSSAAPQIVSGLLGEFFTVFIPLFLALLIWVLFGRQENTAKW